MNYRCNLDAITEVAMFTTFMGRLNTSKLDQNIEIIIKSYINRSITRSERDKWVKNLDAL